MMGRCPSLPAPATWLPLVHQALGEDLGSGDVTTALVIPPEQRGVAILEARQALVACGLPVAKRVFHEVDAALGVQVLCEEGARAEAGNALARIEGPLPAILAAERTALNFVCRLAGVATHTEQFVAAVAGTGARIVDTRKTLPGWRVLDKYAAAVGGAENHRMGLFDGILLKDNHVAAAGGVAAAVKVALENAPPHLAVQVEVESLAEARSAADAGADSLLLDNRTPEEVRAIVVALGTSVLLEATGGVTLENVRAFAETGVHRISIGALTHSAPGADVALEILPGGVRA